MTIFDWDADLAPKGISFARRGMSILGPVSLSGRNQAAAHDAGYWHATLSQMPVGGVALVKAYRRFFARLEGASHQLLVPVFDRAQAPWPVAGVYETTENEFTDGYRFTDGYGFYAATIRVTLATAAAARATLIEVTEAAIAEVVGGEYFSVGVGRLHIITQVVADGVWRIWPPLREALSAGEALNFDNPKCLMRLVNDGVDDLMLTMGRYGFVDIEFVEVLPDENAREEPTVVTCQPTTRILTMTADTTLAADEVDELRVNNTSGAARQITLPKSSMRGRRHLRIVDHGRNSGTYNITIVPAAGETIMGGSSFILDNNGSSIELSPVPDGSGYD